MEETRWDIRRYVGWGITILAVGVVVLCVFFCLYHLTAIRAGIGQLIECLMPVVYGGVIAYLLYPIYRRLLCGLTDLLVIRLKWGEKPARRAAKITAMGLTIALLLVIAAGILSLILPRLAESLMMIVTTFPATMNNMSQTMQGLVHTLFRGSPTMEEQAMSLYAQSMIYAEQWVQNRLLAQTEQLLTYATGVVWSTVQFVKNALIGVVIAIYLMANAPTFCSQRKKLLYALVGVRAGNYMTENLRFANRAFGGYLCGQIADAAMVGLITGITMTIMGMPYALLLGVIIGMTNMIPFFGPFLGAVPCALLVFMVNPVQAVYFLIFILIMQQIDGNIICPRIVGQTTGVSSFWVLFSILLFGGLFGFVGMVAGVPLFAVLEHIISDWVQRLLRRRGLPCSTKDYHDLLRIDEQTHCPAYRCETPRGARVRR